MGGDPANQSAVTVAGDHLEEHLATKWRSGGLVQIDPPPRSWLALKAPLVKFLAGRRRQRRSVPQFIGLPLCAMGREYEAVSVCTGTGTQLPECGACRLRPRCSPPAAWHPELHAYGPAEPAALWSAFHERFSRLIWDHPSETLEPVMQELLASAQAVAGRDFTLEPSIVLTSAGLKKTLRLVSFHGRLPADLSRGIHATHQLLSAAEALQRKAHGRVATALLTTVGRFAPFPMPLGIELTEQGLFVKAYLRVEHFSLERRAALWDTLREMTDIGEPDFSFDRLHMIGLALGPQGCESTKAYLVADPRAAQDGLAACDPEAPLVKLSGRRVYAVVDRAASGRPAKWDFQLRRCAIPGHLVADQLRLSEGPGLAALTEFAAQAPFRMDCVAAGQRGDELALYFELLKRIRPPQGRRPNEASSAEASRSPA